ncbi:hypothetical protein [Lactococcus garvieae]
MKRQDLIESLISRIENENIEITFNDEFPIDAVTNVKRGLMMANLSIVTPFKLAHELVHVLHRDTHRLGECDTTSPQEKRTNKEAIILLWEIFIAEGGSFELFQKFIEISGCPCDTSFAVIGKMNEDIIKELNNENNESKDFSKMSLKECVIDYISHFDIVEQINTYQFLEAYNLPYEKYDAAVEIFKKVLHLDYAC